MPKIKVSRKEVKSILDAAEMREYNGRKFQIVAVNRVVFYDLNWSGGSRREYTFLDMDNSQSRKMAVSAPWVEVREGRGAELPENMLVLVMEYFCGKDCGITIYCHPSRFPRLLPAKVFASSDRIEY